MKVAMQRRALLGAVAASALAACRPAVDQLAKIKGGFAETLPQVGHILREGKLPSYGGSPVRKVHTLIAGGGVAGLSAARALRMQGMEDFVLLDLENEAGGNSRGGSLAGIAHPLGAHYLPVPSDDALEVQDFLQELGLRKRVSGRWVYDEAALCHSPQERLFFSGAWQEGLLPMHGIGKETLAQYRRFAKLVAQWQASGAHRMPMRSNFKENKALPPAQYNKFAIKFIVFLDEQGLNDQHLRWYLDYCCRDDYGAGIDTVSTFAGMHYFAARHGFSAPAAQYADRDDEKEGVLTWPQGNGFLTQALAAPLKERLQVQQLILRIEEGKTEVLIDALDLPSRSVQRYAAQRCIVALPLHVASRVVANAPEFLKAAAALTVHSSWWVANIHIDAPLHDNGQGAFPSWDNVIYGSQGLGYVDAMHQSTRAAPGETVLTYYHAEGAGKESRQALLTSTWAQLRDRALAEIAQAHPDITHRAQQINITRYGHAMAVPTPQFIEKIGLFHPPALNSSLLKSKQYPAFYTPATARLRFAHSDWSGMSVFEEAFTRGLHAAL